MWLFIYMSKKPFLIRSFKIRQILPALLLIAVFGRTAYAEQSASAAVRQYRLWELILTPRQKQTEPLTMKVSAEFTGPAGARMSIPAFWDGRSSWCVRFTPLVPGQWTFSTVSSAADDAGLHGRKGTLDVKPAQGENPLNQHGGILRVSGNCRYLTYSDGTPFFWLGDTWWFCPSKFVPFDTSTLPGITSMYKCLIDKRREQCFSVVHMAFLGESGIEGDYTDLFNGKINPDYWDMVDRYINYANDAGIIPVIGMGFHSSLDKTTLEQMQTLWSYVLARYSAHSVTWLICGEYNQNNPPERVEKVLKLGQFIKDHDPYRRAMTVHPWALGHEKYQVWGQPWYDFTMVQGGHVKNGPSLKTYLDIYERPLSSPLLEGECTYEGIHGFSDLVVRHNAYKAINGGSFGFTYGAHGLWYPTQSEQDQKFKEWGAPIPWWKALELPGGQQMKHLRNFYESAGWWKLAPCNPDDVLRIEPPASNEWQRISVKAEQDRVLLVYIPDGQDPDFKVSLKTAAKNASYTVTLCDPRSGQTRPAGEIVASAPLPALPDRKDWLMILRKK